MTTPATTDALIARLAPQGKASRLLASGRMLAAQLALLAIVTIVAMVACCGLRGDWTHFMTSRDCLTHVGGWVAIGALAALAVAGLARPRWPLSQTALAALGVASLLAVALLGYFVWAFATSAAGPSLMWHDVTLLCVAIVLTTTVFAGAGACLALRHAAPTAPGLFAFALGLVGSSAGMVAIGLVCQVHSAGHMLITHVAPAVVMAGVIGAVCRWACRW